MTMLVKAALIAVGGTLLSGKIASNRAKDPKANVGTGTSPSIAPGEGGGFTPVEGSELKDFADFKYENLANTDSTEQEELMALLQQAGMDGGIVNAAYGGEIEYKANGGGIGGLLEGLEKLMESKPDGDLGGGRPVIDFSQPEMPDPSGPDAVGELMDKSIMSKALMEDINPDFYQGSLGQNPSNLIAGITPEFETSAPGVMTDKMTMEQVPTGMLENAKTGVENYATDNPEMFSAGLGALMDVIQAATADNSERKGSNVRTSTLPGNSARRRSQFQNITPVGGSQVTFANQGSALQRPMFMPNGGAMYGPGGPKDDLIPVMASNGEYMLSKAAVDAAGNGSHAMGIANLEKFNNAGNKRYGN